MSWTFWRAAMPFISGSIGGAAVIIASLLVWHSRQAVGERDWGYFTALFLSASIIGIGGVLVLIAALEIRR